jgi:hypothetical protein
MTNTPDQTIKHESIVITEGSDNRYFSQTSETKEITLYADGWQKTQTHYYEPGDMFNGSDRWSDDAQWTYVGVS